MQDSYDYIIIGAGSAGCVLANRLSADPSRRVLLLEAGGENTSWLIPIPKGFSKLAMDPVHTWGYQIHQPRANGIDVHESWVRGKGLGGSSAINGMIYVRGVPEDFANWAREAGSEWDWPAMKSAYRAIEDHQLGDDGMRGVGGPVAISGGTMRYPLAERMIEAGEQMGLPRKDDLNDGKAEGVGYFSHNIKRGRRISAAEGFLKPSRHRHNLDVKTHVTVDRITFADGRAAGVACRIGGHAVDFACHGEIIISAGALNSPQILQRSGIGDATLLRRLGIPVVTDTPEVGGRMLEHLGVTMTWHLQGDRGINHRLRGLGLAASIVEYLARGSGPLGTGPLEVGAFVRLLPEAKRPDVQLYLGGLTMQRPEGQNVANPTMTSDTVPGMSVYVQMLHLTSEGTVNIDSANPDTPPVITPNWLTTPEDCALAIETIRYVRRYVSQPGLAPVLADEKAPSAAAQTDKEILDFVHTMGTCGTHAVRTCRMGRDNRSVVDERLRVRGVRGLRVADCSVMPDLPSGNTNAPAMAVGWRAADLILADAR